MYTFKTNTLYCFYCKDSMSLLSDLLLRSKRFNHDKLFIVYGKNAEVDLSNSKRSVVINIQRYNNEYKGFLNRYTQIARG